MRVEVSDGAALRSYAQVDVLERCPETGRASMVVLPTGHMAFYQRRPNDCLRAALATLMQVHIVDVPNPRLGGTTGASSTRTRVG
jgi:sugar phosphate isomerase/epimerase